MWIWICPALGRWHHNIDATWWTQTRNKRFWVKGQWKGKRILHPRPVDISETRLCNQSPPWSTASLRCRLWPYYHHPRGPPTPSLCYSTYFLWLCNPRPWSQANSIKQTYLVTALNVYSPKAYLLCSLCPQSLFQFTLQSRTHWPKVQGMSACRPSPFPTRDWVGVNFICRRVRESHLANTSCCPGSFLFYFILFYLSLLIWLKGLLWAPPVQSNLGDLLLEQGDFEAF